MLGFLQSQFFPGFAGIGGLKYSVAVRGHDSSRCVFAHAYIEDVGIAFSYGHCTYRTCGKKSIRDILPMLSGVTGFPESSACGAKVVGQRIIDDTGGSDRAASSIRADIPVFDREILIKIDLACYFKNEKCQDQKDAFLHDLVVLALS